MTDWQGPNPYYLLCVGTELAWNPITTSAVPAYALEHQAIDLDEYQWATTYADWMRKPGEWHLIEKSTDRAILSLLVHAGDQPYYTARHIGATGSAGGNEIIAYGIGKKQVNGEMVRLWKMPNGLICGGDDVDEFGIHLVKELGPK